MNKKEAAKTILKNLTSDEIKILALEAIERRIKGPDIAGEVNTLLNRIIPKREEDFTTFFAAFKREYSLRKGFLPPKENKGDGKI